MTIILILILLSVIIPISIKYYQKDCIRKNICPKCRHKGLRKTLGYDEYDIYDIYYCPKCSYDYYEVHIENL